MGLPPASGGALREPRKSVDHAILQACVGFTPGLNLEVRRDCRTVSFIVSVIGAGSAESNPRNGMPMQVSTEHLLQQANERFAVQDYYGAVHLLDEILESGRRFADVYHLRGLSLSLLGQPEKALEDFDRALSVNPRYIDALVHRGVVLVELGRSGEADASFQRAAALGQPGPSGFSNPVASRLANLHAAVGDAYAEAGALVDAIREYQRAVGLGPHFHDLRYRLARLLLEAARPLEAREELERIVAVQPKFVDAQAALGLAHYLSGDATGAQEIWARCLMQRPENARIGAYLAMARRLVS